MTVREFAVGAVWTASAVGVAQWTWDAYTGQNIPFPGLGGGASDTTNWAGYFSNLPLALAQDVAKQLQKPARKVISALGSGLGTAPKAIKAGPKGTQGAAPGVQPHPGR